MGRILAAKRVPAVFGRRPRQDIYTVRDFCEDNPKKERTYWRLTGMLFAYRTDITMIRGIPGARYQYITGRDDMGVMETIQTILAVCGGISVVGSAAAVIKKWIAPAVKLNDRVKILEEHDKNDFEAINDIKERDGLYHGSPHKYAEQPDFREQHRAVKKTRDKLYFLSIEARIRRMLLKVYDFTVPELDYFRAKCNFTEDERTLLNTEQRICRLSSVRS